MSSVPGVDAVRRRFFQEPLRVWVEQELSDLADAEVVRRLTPVLAGLGGVSVLAAGGYGRRTLHPCSDLDLLILFDTEPDQAAIRRVLAALDGVGFEVGHQVRRGSQLPAFAADQIESYGAFFEARHLAGDVYLSERFLYRTLPRFVEENRAEFLGALLDSQSRRVPSAGIGEEEPDVKTGPGGLRDYHWIRWVAWVMGQSPPASVEDSVGFLHRVRNGLHYITGNQNVLRLGHQAAIANLLGYASGSGLMLEYERASKRIREVVNEWKEKARLRLGTGGGPPAGFPAVEE